jgi:DNA-binding GntR family transcriptional regulator
MTNRGGLKLDSMEGPLEKRIYNTLKNAIKYGYFMPGERLIEATLTEELQVSRTPLREAIRELACKGSVELIPNKGAIVRKLTHREIDDILFISAVLVGAAAGRAVEYIERKDIEKMRDYQLQMENAISQDDYEGWVRLNDKFHGVFVNKCNTIGLVELIREKVDMIPQHWYLLTLRPNPLRIYMEAHERIIEAFVRRDTDLVRSLAENHVNGNSERLKEYLGKDGRNLD